MIREAKKSKVCRRVLVLSLVSLAAAPGCATMKSPTTWFDKEANTAAESGAGMASSLSSTGKGIAGQFKSMGTAVSSAMGKAKTAVTSTFTSSDQSGDPTSLANLPSSLGAEVWVANGQLFESQGNYARALDNYTKALEKEPDNTPALLSTARLYVRQEEHDQAEEFFNKAIAVNPKDAGAFNELAMVQREQGKNAEAQASFQKAITIDPNNLLYRNNLAGSLVAMGRSDEAINQLQQVLTPAEANYNVAFLHFSNKNLAGAQQHLELALQADPTLQPARDLLARIGGNEQAQSAIAAYNTANQIYRTAQAATTPTQAGTAIYQQPSSATAPGMQPYSLGNPATNGLPAYPNTPPAPTSSASQQPSTSSLPPVPANRGYAASLAGGNGNAAPVAQTNFAPVSYANPSSQSLTPLPAYPGTPATGQYAPSQPNLPTTGYPAYGSSTYSAPAAQNRYPQ